MASSLADDGTRIINENIIIIENTNLTISKNIESIFEIDYTIDQIISFGYQRIALQIPDELLQYAWQIVNTMRSKLNERNYNATIFILGDTSYGSCCVDEVNAMHNNADFIVHYGDSCMSRSARIPMLLVFCQLEWNNIETCVDMVKCKLDPKSNILILRNTGYDYLIGTFATELQNHGFSNIFVAPTIAKYFDPKETKLTTTLPDMQNVLGQQVPKSQTFSHCIYVGPSSSVVTQITLKTGIENVLILDPQSGTFTQANASILTKRYHKVQQAKDASVIGILVGTMGVRGYEETIEYLRKIITDQGRKSYTFLVGKINPQKLANFSVVDVFVLVACEQNSLIDSKEYFKPIVTPWELEIALGYREWSTEYSCAFADLKIDDVFKPLDDNINMNDDEEDIPHFSAATGRLVNPRIRSKVNHTSNDTHLTIRYESPAADLLVTQSYRGLEATKGDKPAAKAIPGQTGIASTLYALDEPQKPK